MSDVLDLVAEFQVAKDQDRGTDMARVKKRLAALGVNERGRPLPAPAPAVAAEAESAKTERAAKSPAKPEGRKTPAEAQHVTAQAGVAGATGGASGESAGGKAGRRP